VNISEELESLIVRACTVWISANRNQESIAAMFFARSRQNEQSLQSTPQNINVIKGRTTIISANDDSNWWTMDDELDVMTISHTTLMYMSAKTGTLRILSPMATPLSLIMNAVQSHFFMVVNNLVFIFFYNQNYQFTSTKYMP